MKRTSATGTNAPLRGACTAAARGDAPRRRFGIVAWALLLSLGPALILVGSVLFFSAMEIADESRGAPYWLVSSYEHSLEEARIEREAARAHNLRDPVLAPIASR